MRFPNDRSIEPIANSVEPAASLTRVIVIIFLMFAALTPLANAQSPQYELTWLGEGRPRDINESGVVAFGWASAVYDHATGIKLDLNDLANGATWTDLEDNGDETGQWTVYHCNGINESNQIIGSAIHNDGFEEGRAFVLEFSVDSPPAFKLLPRVGNGENRGHCINDFGVCVVNAPQSTTGVKTFVFTSSTTNPVGISGSGNSATDINNAGVIVDNDGFVTVPDDAGNYSLPPVHFEGHWFSGINDLGLVTGYRSRINGGPPSGRRDGGPVLFHYQGGSELIVSGSETNYHGDVNNLGVVAFSEGGRGFIHGPGFPEPLNLDSLLVNPDNDWLNWDVFPSGINDAGQIIGQANGLHGFILTPITPGPSISVNDLTIDEGNSGTTTPGHFTVTLSELSGEDVVVPYVIVDGTAAAGDDYTASASSGLLTFAFSAGETSRTVQFTIIGDDTNESDETFVIQLGEAIGGAVVSKSEGTATIKNDDKKRGRK